MFKLKTPDIRRHARRSNVHCGICARRGNVKTHLGDRKIPCSTSQTHDDCEVRTSSRSILRQVCPKWRVLRENDVRIDKIYHWTDSSTVVTVSSQEAASVCSLGQRKYWKNSSMDQWRHGIKNPADIGKRGISMEGLKECGWLNGPARLQTDEKIG